MAQAIIHDINARATFLCEVSARAGLSDGVLAGQVNQVLRRIGELKELEVADATEITSAINTCGGPWTDSDRQAMVNAVANAMANSDVARAPKRRRMLQQCQTYENYIKASTYEILKDCLLYTSPSPRDRTRSRMPSSA